MLTLTSGCLILNPILCCAWCVLVFLSLRRTDLLSELCAREARESEGGCKSFPTCAAESWGHRHPKFYHHSEMTTITLKRPLSKSKQREL